MIFLLCPFAYDCFSCPARDCIADYFPRRETRQSDVLDLAILRENRKIRFRPRLRFKPFRGRPGTYYALHRDERLSYQHGYYLANRDRLRLYGLFYYRLHRSVRLNYQLAYYRSKVGFYRE